MIDLHTHILPWIDDGARSIEESRALATAAAAEGVRAIAATPHVRSDYPTRAAVMEHGVEGLRRDFAQTGIAVEVLHGAEVELGLLREIPVPELNRLTLAQSGRYLLLEFPYRGWPSGLDSAIAFLHGIGMTPIFAHPERNPAVQDEPDRLVGVISAGAVVQVTSASLDGRLGPASKQTAERLLELGLVQLLASDAHGPHIRVGGLAAAAARVEDPARREYLTVTVPEAIVAGRDLPPAP